MSSYYFFTDIDLLSTQTAGDEFGPVSGNLTTQYRVNSLHDASGDPRAIAVTKGIVFVQQDANSSLVNLVLKPLVQPDFGFSKVDYYIYKGIKKTSLINGSEIATRTNNDLTEKLWSTQDEINLSIGSATGTTPTDTPSVNALGFNYTSSASAPYLTADTAALSIPFYQDNVAYQLSMVQAGMSLGDFDSNGFGFEVVLESIGFEPTFAIARNLNHVVQVTALSGTPTDAEEFEYFHDKEEILNYIDPCAYFAAFYHEKLKVVNSSSIVTTESGNGVYDTVVTKFVNKNSTYLDIRQPQGYSFNYYKDFGKDIKIAYSSGGTVATTNFYQNDWPLMRIASTSFPTGNTTTSKNNIKLSLPEGVNALPVVYMDAGYQDNRSFRKARRKDRFVELTVSSSWTSELTLMTPNRDGQSGTTPICSYTKLRHLAKVNTSSPVATANKTLGYGHYLDQLVAAFDFDMPFTGTNDISIRRYNKAVYADMSTEMAADFIADVGMADSSNQIVFFAFPSEYHTSSKKVLPGDFGISTSTYTGSSSFLELLEERVEAGDLRKSQVTISSVNKEYLKLEDDELFRNALSSNELETTILINLTKTQYNTLVTTKNSQFSSKYRVFLGVSSHTNANDDLNNPYTSFELTLKGLEEVSSAVQSKQVLTGITFYSYGHI